MTTYRSWMALALTLLICTSISTSMAYARDEYFDYRGAVSHGADVDHWDDGQWFHGDHLGRVGWWWVVGGAWYFYPSPVYPYPDPYAYVPRSEAGPLSNYAYYCPSVNSYYPYVTECPWGWRLVVPQQPRS